MLRSLLHYLGILTGWIELAVFTLLLYLISYLPQAWHSKWFRRLFRLWSRVWVGALGVDLRLHQHNRQPLPEQYLMIANHPSAFEDIGIPALFDVDCLAKDEVRRWFLVGRISEAANTLYVHRESRESRQQAANEIVEALQQGRNIALYPEGGVKDKRLHDHFRYGAFSISLRTGVPIVPVFIHYEAQDDFHWGEQSLPRKMLQIMGTRNNRANYHVFDPFEPGDFSDRESYCDAVYRQYLAWQEKYLD